MLGEAGCPLRLFDANKDTERSELTSKAPSGINSDVPFAFETAGFKGHMLFYVAGLPDTPTKLFQGRRRRSHMVIKGTFKHAVSFEDTVTGQRFSKPLSRLPSLWFLELIFMLARRFSPSMQIGCREAPYVLSPLISTAQVISVTKGEDSTDISSKPEEDMRAVGVISADGISPMAAKERRRTFLSPKNRQGQEFRPGLTYTFHFWQHMLDCAAFKLDLGIAAFDLAKHLNGQPLQLMAQQSSSGAYLWQFHLQHDSQC